MHSGGHINEGFKEYNISKTQLIGLQTISISELQFFCKQSKHKTFMFSIAISSLFVAIAAKIHYDFKIPKFLNSKIQLST